MSEIVAMIKPCGAGKTAQACEYAAIEASRGRSVLYIVPTRALMLEVAERIRGHGARVMLAAGRSAKRQPINCSNPLADLADAGGFSLLSFCQTCPHFRSCDYINARAMIVPPETVAIATLSFLVWNRIPLGKFDIVICDEMPSLLEVDAEHIELLPDPSRAALVHLSTLPASIRRAVRRYCGLVGREPPAGFLIPTLPRGSERTLILTATPVPGLLERMVGGEVMYESEREFWGLDQRVEWFFESLPHTKDWEPEAFGCGFKKNTRPGMPYFRASIGLNAWRGVPLRAYGSFNPPPHVWLVLAFILRAELVIDHVDVVFDASPENDPLGLARRMRIPSWTLSFRIDGKTIPIPWLVQASDLAQLLGRSGVGMDNSYVGSIPLVARNTTWSYRLAREVRLVRYDPADVLLEVLTSYMLFARRPIDAVLHAFPEAARYLNERLVRAATRRAKRVRELVRSYLKSEEEEEHGTDAKAGRSTGPVVRGARWE